MSAKQRQYLCSPPPVDSTNYWMCFEFPFNLIGKSQNGLFNRPIMVRAQILVHRWKPSTRISTVLQMDLARSNCLFQSVTQANL